VLLIVEKDVSHVFGKCDNQEPKEGRCLKPDVVTKCLTNVPCKGSKEQSRQRGMFRKKAANGFNAVPGEDDSLCYYQYDCQPFGMACQINNATKSSFYALPLVKEACPPGG
jgi:hypothetical protein